MKFKLLFSLLFLVLLVFSIGIPCFARENNVVTLQMKPMNLQDDRFYIKEVIDGRIDKSNIGYRKWWPNDAPLTLNGDFSNLITSYLNVTFSVSDKKTPLFLKINVLEIGEQQRLTDLYTHVKVKIGFYIENNGKLGKVFETESYIEQKAIYDKYEQLIREALERCMTSFSMSNWENTKPAWEDYQVVKSLSHPNDYLVTNPSIWHYGFFLEGSNSNALNISNNEANNEAIYNFGLFEYIREEQGKIKLNKSYVEFLIVNEKDEINLFFGHKAETLHRIGNSNFIYSFTGDIPIGLHVIGNKLDSLLIGLKFEQGIGFLLGAGKISNGMIYIKLYERHWWSAEPDSAGIKMGFTIPIK